MAEIRNSNRSPSVGEIADFLLYGKSGLNKYEIKKWVPLLGGTGLGDLFMGQAPELMDDTSYYGLNALLNGGNRATGGIGTLAPDKRTFDAAMLGMDATGLASLVTKLGGNLSKSALNKMAIEAGNLSRRKFLKGSAAVAGGVALGGLLKLGKEAGEQVAKHSTDNITNKVVKEAPKKYKFNSLKEYNDYLNDIAEEEASIAWSESTGRPRYDMPEDYFESNRLQTIHDPKEWKKRLALEDEALYREAKDLGGIEYEAKLHEFSPQAKAEMKEFKTKYKAYTDSYNEMKLTDRYHPEFEDYAEGTPYPDIEHWSFFLDDPKTNKLMFDAESLKNYEMLIDNLKTSSIKDQQDHRLYGDYINNSNFTGSFNDYLDTLLKQK